MRHYQGCTKRMYKFELVRYIYGHTCAIIVAHATHMYCGQSLATAIFVWENVMWADLRVGHFEDVVTIGNGHHN